MSHDLGKQKLHIKSWTWAVPGAEQSLDELIEKLGDRVLRIERDKNRLLVASEESVG